MSQELTNTPHPDPLPTRWGEGVPLAPVPALAVALVLAFVVVKLAMHFLTTAITPYGLHCDELLYWGMGQHLRLWNMTFPPAIAILAKTAQLLFGNTLFAVRFFSALGGAGILILTALVARELGGGRFAQGVGMLAVFCSPVFVRPAVLFQPVVWDQFCWTLGLWALARIVRDPGPRRWALLGVAIGLGLLVKFSIVFFSAALFVALLLSPQRAALRTRGPWLAALIALAVGSPSIVGQIRQGIPAAFYLHDLQSQQLTHVTALSFLGEQVLMLGPAVILAIVGLFRVLAGRDGRQFRVIGLTCALAFLLLWALHGKSYHIAPIYPALLAAGGVALGELSGRRGKIRRGLAPPVLALAGVVVLPFGLPILPPPLMARYAAKMGVTSAVTSNRGGVLPLPQDYAEMLGWEEQVKAVRAVYEKLAPEKQARVDLIASNYGGAGALEFYGARYGLPSRIMLPNDFLVWPPLRSCEVAITLNIPVKDVEKFFGSVTLADRVATRWAIGYEQDVPICVGEKPIRDLSEAWVRRGFW